MVLTSLDEVTSEHAGGSDLRKVLALAFKHWDIQVSDSGVTVAGKHVPEWDLASPRDLLEFFVFKQWVHASAVDQSVLRGGEVSDDHPKTAQFVIAPVPSKKLVQQGASILGPRFESWRKKRQRSGIDGVLMRFSVLPVQSGSSTIVTEETYSLFAGPYLNTWAHVVNEDVGPFMEEER